MPSSMLVLRKEEKLDAILRQLNPAEAERIISQLEQKHPKP